MFKMAILSLQDSCHSWREEMEKNECASNEGIQTSAFSAGTHLLVYFFSLSLPHSNALASLPSVGFLSIDLNFKACPFIVSKHTRVLPTLSY